MLRNASDLRRGWLAAVLLAAAIGAAPVSGAAALPTQPPARTPAWHVDLDAFEARKQRVMLPDGVRLAYLQMGDPAAPAVVLIHGYTDSARDWVAIAPQLAAHRLILVDLRGHGKSDRPECCYSLYDFAYDIKLLLDQLHIDRAALLGHSLGSLIAQKFAETWPARTRAVVLISSSGGRPHCGSHPRPHEDFGARIRTLTEPLTADSPFMHWWWSSPTPVDEDFLRREREDAARIPLRVWFAVLDQALSFGDLQDSLPRLTAPALLIWGGDDPLMGAADRASLRTALPHAQVRIFPGLGHNPFWEQPAAVAAAIEGFLAAHP